MIAASRAVDRFGNADALVAACVAVRVGSDSVTAAELTGALVLIEAAARS